MASQRLKNIRSKLDKLQLGLPALIEHISDPITIEPAKKIWKPQAYQEDWIPYDYVKPTCGPAKKKKKTTVYSYNCASKSVSKSVYTKPDEND